MNSRLDLEYRTDPKHFSQGAYGIIAIVSRKVSPEWEEFNLRRRTVSKVEVSDCLLKRVGTIAQAYDLPLLSRLVWVQSRFAPEQLDSLIDECEWLYGILNDPASQQLIQILGEAVSQAETTKLRYPDIHWVLTVRNVEHSE
ncbi:hypothetical protein ACFP81_05015 [Deinococcus lacus]|uniref:Uncharacterized protein n=1 Tax=Deinococcus lacus TaxID=392561 RepID=A0ABW1YB45_9DEIO